MKKNLPFLGRKTSLFPSPKLGGKKYLPEKKGENLPFFEKGRKNLPFSFGRENLNTSLLGLGGFQIFPPKPKREVFFVIFL
jgi:hypothetical protein